MRADLKTRVVPTGIVMRRPFYMPTLNMDNVSYYGCGPYENYSDKHHSCWTGRFNTTADEMFEDYIKPQEKGSRHGCREIMLENSVLGLKVEKLNKTLAFNLSHYTQEELTQKTHN